MPRRSPGITAFWEKGTSGPFTILGSSFASRRSPPAERFSNEFRCRTWFLVPELQRDPGAKQAHAHRIVLSFVGLAVDERIRVGGVADTAPVLPEQARR